MCNRTCTPAEWQSLSVQERADLWPVMTQENRRHIWMLMDDAEKRALREKLRRSAGKSSGATLSAASTRRGSVPWSRGIPVR